MALRLGKWINLLSGNTIVGDKCLLVAACNTQVDPEIMEVFGKSFREVKGTRLVLSADIEYGENPWPKNPNHQFLSVCEYISQTRKDIDAFYYLEPDNLPIKKDWWQRIVAEYSFCKKPLWGPRSEYIGTGQHEARPDTHMIGTGIYPQNVWTSMPCFEAFSRKKSSEPWDAATGPQTNPVCYFSDLVAHHHQSRGYRIEPSGDISRMRVFKKPDRTMIERDDAIIPEEAVMVHGCKDGSLRRVIAQKLGLQWTEPLTFRHSGDIGDIIYSLAAIKNLGGGVLYLAEKGGQREPMTPERQKLIVPLLEAQPYLTVEPNPESDYVDYDFRYFRVSHVTGKNLALTHAEWCGADLDCLVEPWLTVEDSISIFQGIVINRTARYQTDSFPWKNIRNNASRVKSIFIGLPEERADFEKKFGNVEYMSTSNFLEVARLINGSLAFAGNQSACFAVAEGLKHRRIQETFVPAPDCVFKSDNALYVTDGKIPEDYFTDWAKETAGDFQWRVYPEGESDDLRSRILHLMESDRDFALKFKLSLENIEKTNGHLVEKKPTSRLTSGMLNKASELVYGKKMHKILNGDKKPEPIKRKRGRPRKYA